MRWALIVGLLVSACASGPKTLPEQVADVCLGYVGVTNALYNAHLLGQISAARWEELQPVGIYVGEQCADQSQVQSQDALDFLSSQLDKLIAARAEVKHG